MTEEKHEEKHTVLLADDDPDLSWAVGKFLTRAGLTVVTCTDGAEAISLIESREFDTLITDIQMPKVNGLALIDWVREHRPNMRVVVMTAFGSPFLRDLALRKGAILYLEKPVDPSILLEVIRSATSNTSFSGSVNEIDLFDYVQLMLLTQRQVVLEVSSRTGDQGMLFIDRGTIRHAVCMGLEGEDAFYRCMGFEGGSFTTLPWREPEKATINVRGDFLLMEAVRKKDEADRDSRAIGGEGEEKESSKGGLDPFAEHNVDDGVVDPLVGPEGDLNPKSGKN
jgi:DNA-binding NarL/FixJ family response regulator